MSTRPLQLVGEVDDRDNLIESLRLNNRHLEDELATTKAELRRVMKENGNAIGELRKVLTPLYAGLQRVFGEMEAIAGEEYEVPPSSHVSKVWESWKLKLPGNPAHMIDALLLHGELNAAQLRVHMHCATQTVYDTATKLNKAGLIVKNGSMYKLKQV